MIRLELLYIKLIFCSHNHRKKVYIYVIKKKKKFNNFKHLNIFSDQIIKWFCYFAKNFL